MEDQEKTTVQIDNHSMTVRIEGQEDAQKLMQLASTEMERLERERLRGELQNIEEYPQADFLQIE